MRRIVEQDVEDACIEWLEELGYDYVYGPEISPDGEHSERKNYSDIILIERLRSALERINKLPKTAIDDAIKKIIYPDTPNLIDNNHNFHKMLTDGVDVEFEVDGETKFDKVWILDFNSDKIELNNEFLVVNQYTVIEKENRRPDVILFINGIPLVLIELKNPRDTNATLWKAFKQVQLTYQSEIPSMFLHNEITIISDGTDARIGTTTTPWSRFAPWKTIDGENIASESEPQLKVIIKGMLEKKRLLDIIRNFIVFESEGPEIIKKLANYHQIRAANNAVRHTIRASSQDGNKKIGVVWHATGSGKSLTMTTLSGKIIQEPLMKNPTIVVITDRNDLDDQLFGTFFKSRELLHQEPEQAKTRNDMRGLLKVESGGVIFTTVQKFVPEKGEDAPLLSDRRNIVVMADEAHRSQYDVIDGFARHLRDSLPNASFIGFTATPIETADKNTKTIFGDYIDIYDMMQSVEDGFTVRINHEPRHSKLNIDSTMLEKIDPAFNKITENSEEDERKKLKSKWSRLEAVVGSNANLQQLAKDIVEHFENRRVLFKGKGMIVCMSRKICADLYDEIIKLRKEWHNDDDQKGFLKVVMTGKASDPENFQLHIRSKKKRKLIEKRLKDDNDELSLVIVRDMWLAGFDVPFLHTMYIAKPMQTHSLIQAISRVNRVHENKPGGLIVDYISIAHEMKKAINQYTKDLKQDTIIPIEEAVEVFKRKYQLIKDMLIGFDYSKFFSGKSTERLEVLAGAMSLIVDQEEGKKRFKQASNDLMKSAKLCGAHEEILAVRDNIVFFDTLQRNLSKNTGIGVSYTEETDVAVGELVTKSMESLGVEDLLKASGIVKTPEISILSDEFLQDVKSTKRKNLAVELLSKLVSDQIKTRRKKNIVHSNSLLEKLQKTIQNYEKRPVDAVDVITELISISKEIRDARKRGEKLKLTEEELAFYDTLDSKDSSVKVLGDEVLTSISKELVEVIQKSKTIDWPLRESGKAKIMSSVKRVLNKHGYPVPKKESATQAILEQASQMFA
jgi:type I restriction enzyme, R subunit